MRAIGSLVRAEVGTHRALWRGILRRSGTVPGVAPGAVPLPYSPLDGAVLAVLIGVSVVEIGVVHLLVPWPPLRWALLVLGIYSLLWLAGAVMSLRQHPHLLREGELLLRLGHFRAIPVPLDGLVAVRQHHQGDHRRNVVVDGDRLAVSFLGDTHVELRFDPAVEVEVGGVPRRVDRVAFAAVDARAAVRLLRAQAEVSPGR